MLQPARLGHCRRMVKPIANALVQRHRHSTVSAAAAAAATSMQQQLGRLPLLQWRHPLACARPHLPTNSTLGCSTALFCSARSRTAGEASSTSGTRIPESAAAYAPPPPGRPPHRGGAKRQRLDDYCLARHPDHTKNLIQSWIAQGKVLVNDRVVTKAGTPVPKGAVVRINAEQPKYVCRAGHKLQAALDHFEIDVAGLTALDAGLSTGGFTDCLLQGGVGRVRFWGRGCCRPWGMLLFRVWKSRGSGGGALLTPRPRQQPSRRVDRASPQPRPAHKQQTRCRYLASTWALVRWSAASRRTRA